MFRLADIFRYYREQSLRRAAVSELRHLPSSLLQDLGMPEDRLDDVVASMIRSPAPVRQAHGRAAVAPSFRAPSAGASALQGCS